MSEPKLISPMLDNFVMGDPISDHYGVRSCPALQKDTDDRYIVKIISTPASQVQLDALLLSGAYPDKDAALNYFKSLSDDIVREAEALSKLSKLEGFLSFDGCQVEPMEEETGYDVYLLSKYRKTLQQHLRHNATTHLEALNLGLDICAALTICRQSGYLYINLKPGNIYITPEQGYKIGDVGLVNLASLKYASLPERYRSQYTAPEIQDPYASLNTTVDTYALGLILYQVFNDGMLPFKEDAAPAEVFPAPAYADYEMAEIILKACAPDPADRWEDPAQLGQALVSYMQRNGAHNTPITPVAESAEAETPYDEDSEGNFEAPAEEEAEPTEAEATEEAPVAEETAEAAPTEEETTEEETTEEETTEEETTEEAISVEEATEAAPVEDTAAAEQIPEVTEEAPAQEEAPIETEEAPAETEETPVEEDSPAEPAPDTEEAPVIEESDIFTEDEEGNLTLLTDEEDETTPGEETETEDYTTVSDEVSDMLQQADDLIAHQAPDPVVQPEPIDVQLPEPEPEATQEQPQDATEEAQEDTADAPAEADAEAPEAEEAEEAADQEAAAAEPKPEAAEEEPAQPEDTKKTRKRGKGWIWGIILALLIAGLVVAGIYLYKNYYLQTVDSIVLEDGETGTLTVMVTSQVSEEKLTVICSDTYGNQQYSAVENGKATFTGLAPNSAYTVRVEITGFHKLTGDTSAAYTTPKQTEIVELNCVTGAEDGSVVVSFAIDGADADAWRISYTDEAGNFKETEFDGHTVTINGLTVGQSYKLALMPVGELLVIGQTETEHVACKTVKAIDLQITGCYNGKLTAAWDAPADAAVENWTVRCYNESGFDQTCVVTEMTAEFTVPDSNAAYTVEVTAAGMSVNERAFSEANAISLTLTLDTASNEAYTLTWKAAAEGATLPQGPWVIEYSVDGVFTKEFTSETPEVSIFPIVPGAKCKITVKTADAIALLGNTIYHTTRQPDTFKGYAVSADVMEFNMCKTPSYSGWDHYDISEYTTTFQTGQKASFVIRMRAEYNTSDDEITTAFVVRNSAGQVVEASSSTEAWWRMWRRNFCELDIPSLPTAPGEYTISVYFNGDLAGEVNFTITE